MMKQLFPALCALILLASCDTTKNITGNGENTVTGYGMPQDTPIIQSLFNDKASTI